ncbi:MAG TPA: AAA family ATPase [Candidatus Limnocylindrales bacterium]|nr:AAA family ATPase [Candidatus Limnocylindrales bacterium]
MPFIGREAELGSLAGALQRAAQAETSRLVIRGPLGIGISHLLDELARRLGDVEDVIVCRGRAEAPLSGVPYAAVSAALAGPLASVDEAELPALVGGAGYDLAAIVPGLAERLARAGDVPRAPALDAPDQRGTRLQEAVLGLLERLAGRRVICLILEDLQHSDPGTRELVQGLLRLSRPMPLTLIATYHTDELQRGHPAWDFVRELAEHRAVETIELGPMERVEISALVEAIRGEKPALGLVAAIMEGSKGNPLIAGQLVGAQAEVAGLRLSDPFVEIVHARLAALAPSVRRVLRVLAAARRPVSRQLLLDLRLAGGHIARADLQAALASGLASEQHARLAIVHQLVAEATEELAMPADRQALHAALAEALSDEPAEQAWHWAAAQRPAEARACHLAAARLAERIEPGHTALLHYQRALELGEAADTARDEKAPRSTADGAAEVLAAAAQAAEAAGLFRRAAALAEQAIERVAGGRVERLIATSARERREDWLAASVLSERLGRYRRASGDPQAAQRALEQAAVLGCSPDQGGVARARALASLAQHLMLGGQFADSARLAEEACAVAAALDPPALAEQGHATCTLGVDVAYLGDVERGLALLEEATALSRSCGLLDDVMRAYANRTTLLDLDSRREEALAVVSQGIAEASANGLGLTYGAFLRGNAADILFQLGRWREAEEECRAAMEFPPAGLAWVNPLLYLGLLLAESRADEEAARFVGRTVLELEAVPPGQWSALVLRAGVSLAIWRGDVDGARRVAETEWQRVLGSAEELQIAAAASTVLEACAASAEAGRERREWGPVAEAGELAARVLPEAERQVAEGSLPSSIGARREAELHLATARAHERRIRGRARPSDWARLAQAWTAVPVPYQAAKAHWWHAAAALEARDRGAAKDALHAAWRISGELPARPLRRALAALAERGLIPLPDDGPVTIPVRPGARLPVAMGPGRAIAERVSAAPSAVTMQTFGLSQRESSVLLLLAEGLTNREIGERLYIRQATVAVHVRRVLAKLGVSNRIEATGMAIRLGLVPEKAGSASYVAASRH